jgi:hypothetical protein
MSAHFSLASIVVYSLLAVGVFILPLIGLHQLLLQEKERLLAEADSRLQAHIQDLHLRIDNHQLQDADAINPLDVLMMHDYTSVIVHRSFYKRKKP